MFRQSRFGPCRHIGQCAQKIALNLFPSCRDQWHTAIDIIVAGLTNDRRATPLPAPFRPARPVFVPLRAGHPFSIAIPDLDSPGLDPEQWRKRKSSGELS